MPPSVTGGNQRVIGRYVLHDEIASGGMAKVHLGRLQGQVGFARTVAIKRLHEQFASDPEFREMFVDEAHIVARIQHPNVVGVLDVVALEGELFLVMEYVHGVPLMRLLRRLQKAGKRVDPRIAVSIGTGMLYGLHAAHDAVRESGEPLNIVHRDVNPQNVMVGADGVARVLDFGIAKASHRYHHTGQGVVKGKLRYMAPEQVADKPVDRRSDVFAASVVMWEMLTGENLFTTANPAELIDQIVKGTYRTPSAVAPEVPAELDAVIMKGLAPYPKHRYQTALEMAVDLERAVPPATTREVGEWVMTIAGDSLHGLERMRAAVEGASPPLDRVPASPSASDPAVDGSLGSAPMSAVSSIAPVSLSRRAKVLILAGAVIGASLLGFGAAAVVSSRVAGPAPTGAASTGRGPSTVAIAPDNASASLQSAGPLASAVLSSPPVASTASAKPKPVPIAGPPKNCRPPYTIGADGVKRYKPECF